MIVSRLIKELNWDTTQELNKTNYTLVGVKAELQTRDLSRFAVYAAIVNSKWFQERT